MPVIWGRGMAASLDSLAKRFGAETEGETAEESGAASAEEAAPKGPFQEWLDSRGGPLKWEAPHFGVMVGEIERLAAPVAAVPGSMSLVQEDGLVEGEPAECRVQSAEC